MGVGINPDGTLEDYSPGDYIECTLVLTFCLYVSKNVTSLEYEATEQFIDKLLDKIQF